MTEKPNPGSTIRLKVEHFVNLFGEYQTVEVIGYTEDGLFVCLQIQREDKQPCKPFFIMMDEYLRRMEGWD